LRGEMMPFEVFANFAVFELFEFILEDFKIRRHHFL
jgi:hypothetical protein